MRMVPIAAGFGLIVALGAALTAFMLTRPVQIVDRTPPEIDAARMALVGWRQDGDGPVLVLPAPDGGVDVFERRGVGFVRRKAPQDPVSWPPPAEPPYAVRAVETRGVDGIRIAATVFMPSNPRAGVVIIHGSGDSDRRNGWYLDIADELARRGVAVWFPDKRGTGVSGGRWRDASFELLARDAVASQAAMAGLMGVRPEAAVGYLGVSQGGWIAPLAARMAPSPFVVSLSAAAVTPDEQLRHEVRANLRRDLPGFMIPVAMPIAGNLPRWRYPDFWRANGAINPVEAIRAGGTPTLVVLGDRDEDDNVPVARSVDLYRAAEIDVMLVQGGGHDLSPGEGVGPIDRTALARIEAFIVRHGPGREDRSPRTG